MNSQELLQSLTTFFVQQACHIELSEKNISLNIHPEKKEILISAAFCFDSLKPILQNYLHHRYPDWSFSITYHIFPHKVQANIPLRQGVKNIIAIASGKGGVGKSTVAVNLALALQKEGARVGILDADIYGPSLPIMLHLQEAVPESVDGKTLEPIQRLGLQVMSIGCLLKDKDSAMIWRGPMVSTALQQLFRDCQWKNLDYLIIDLPPGTGDIQLTLAQKIPVTGAIIVTTPQDIALADAKKAYAMFQKVNIPVLGIVENMSYHQCSHCGHHEAIFGEGGGENLAGSYHVPLLGKIPLLLQVRQDLDSGVPTVAQAESSAIKKCFSDIAIQTSAYVAQLPVARVSRIPQVVVE